MGSCYCVITRQGLHMCLRLSSGMRLYEIPIIPTCSIYDTNVQVFFLVAHSTRTNQRFLTIFKMLIALSHLEKMWHCTICVIVCVFMLKTVLLQEKLVRTNTVTSCHRSIWQLNSERDSQNVLNNSNCMLDNNNLHISLFWHISVGGDGENTFPLYVFFSHRRTWPHQQHNVRWIQSNTCGLLGLFSHFQFYPISLVSIPRRCKLRPAWEALHKSLFFSSCCISPHPHGRTHTHTQRHRQLAQYKESHHSLSVIPEASLYRPDSH